MLYRNLKQDEAFDFISNLDFDVLCLQEVPEEFLPRLAALPYQMATTTDATLTRGAATLTMHHAILTPHPLHASASFDMPSLSLPLRALIGLRLKEGWAGLAKREGLYADIDLPTGLVRVFSVHPAVLSPSARARDFDAIAKYFSEGSSLIIAGDFNTADHPIAKPFSWLFGASFREALPWHNERAEVERLFAKWGLQNPLRGKVTLGITLSQLDHILVPKSAEVVKAEVMRDTHGSDHNPVFVEAWL